MQVGELSFGYGDVQRLGPGVAVNLALLAVQAGLGPDCDILGNIWRVGYTPGPNRFQRCC